MFLEVDPNSVVAGWVPLLIVIGIGVIIALLYWSMRHEMGKINVPTRAEIAAQERAQEETSATG